MPGIDAKLLSRLHDRALCARWGVSRERFAAALEASAARASAPDLTRYLEGLHVQDLALACACADGSDAAWEHFILTYRPGLYRAAEAIAPGGGARDLADALYGDLFGTRERDGERQSLFKVPSRAKQPRYVAARGAVAALRRPRPRWSPPRTAARRRCAAASSGGRSRIRIAPGTWP